MKYLVPLARVNRVQCAQLVAGLGDTRVSDRELEIVDEGLLQRALVHGGAGRKPQELEHVRIADERARSLIDATGLRQREYGVTLGG